jgi:hypothetical protein
MKTILAIIGGLAIAFIAVVVAVFFIGMNELDRLAEEATAFVDEAVPAIAGEWRRDELIARASPELMAIVTDADVNELMFAGMVKLGPMKAYKGSSCMIVRFEMSTEGESAIADCTASAEFEMGPATFQVGLKEAGAKWGLAKFFFTTPSDTGAVMAAYDPAEKPGDLEISLRSASIAMTTGSRFERGIGWRSANKIENLQ